MIICCCLLERTLHHITLFLKIKFKLKHHSGETGESPVCTPSTQQLWIVSVPKAFPLLHSAAYCICCVISLYNSNITSTYLFSFHVKCIYHVHRELSKKFKRCLSPQQDAASPQVSLGRMYQLVRNRKSPKEVQRETSL